MGDGNDGRVDDRGPAATIYAVAERAGVSTATVSRALRNPEKVTPRTREIVLQAARELDYLPRAAAQALAGQRTHAIGLVLPHIAGPYYSELLVGFEMAASRLGFSVVITLANPRSDSRAAVWGLATQVDGIAFMARSAAEDDLIAHLGRRRPVVTGARSRIPGHSAFFVENRLAAQQLTEHLIGHGRRAIGFVGRRETGSDIGERHKGWAAALHAHGLPPGPTFEVDPREEPGLEVADRLLAQHLDVDALVCGNDELALAIMLRLQEHGLRVPEDVAITGWDDTRAARYISPSLTTVRQPVSQLGELAAERLVHLIRGHPVDVEDVTLPAHHVHRRSCGCDPTPSTTGSTH